MQEDEQNKRDDESPIIRGVRRLIHGVLGVQFPEDLPKLRKTEGSIALSTYSETEMRHLPGFDRPSDMRDVTNTNIPMLDEYLRGVSQRSGDWSEQMKTIQILTPEINRSADIMVSSIMSPTDIQTTSVSIKCSGTDLGDNIEQSISKMITSFMNDDVDLGPRTYKYIKESLYGEGSASVLILPQSNVNKLNKAMDVDIIKAGNLDILNRNYRELEEIDKRLKHEEPVVPSLEGADQNDKEQSIPSLEFLLPEYSDNSTEKSSLLESISTEAYFALESSSYMTTQPSKDEKNKNGRSTEKAKHITKDDFVAKSKDEIKAVLEVFSKSKSAVTISRDVSAVHDTELRLRDRIEKMAQDVEKNFLFDKQNPTFLLDDVYDPDEKQNPAIIELPSRAVVPITIPGSPEKHIGYFILLDQWGSPMFGTHSANDSMQYGPRRLSEAAASAALGTSMVYRFNSAINDEDRYELTSTVFGITLRQLLDNRLKDYGLLGASVELNEAITTCIFRQILAKKQCKMVFVPEPMMMYMRFDHREDGTGKAITEQLSTLLSMRTVLVMSYIMAATENSVNNRVITVDVDEKQTNVPQYLELIRNAYSNKKLVPMDINPITVQQGLIQKSLTIIPKGIKGLPNSLDIQTEHRQTGAIAPDEGLLEKLDDWIVTALEVPHSALNQLSENEYSRSVASSNLYFSNNIKSKQRIVIKYMTKFVRLYVRYSKVLREAIAKIITTTDATEKEVNSMEGADTKSEITIERNKDKNTDRRIQMVINHLCIELPTPRIVVDKTQYVEIEQYITTIEKILDSVYPDEIASGAAQEVQEINKVLKAIVKQKMIRDYITEIGFQSIYDIPSIDAVDTDFVQDALQVLLNLSNSIAIKYTQLKKAASDGTTPDMGATPGGGTLGGGAGGTDEWGSIGGEEPMGTEGGTPGGEEGGALAETGAETTNETPEGNDFNKVQEPPKL